MKCPVCTASTPDSNVCKACGYDTGAPGADSPDRVLAAREVFKQKVTGYDPKSRVNAWDRAKPWISVVLGALLFVFVLRMCARMGYF